MGAILASLLLREPACPSWKDEFGIPLPTVFHTIIKLQDIGDREVLVIGDVHGCLDELKDLLEKVNYSPESTLLVFCGDIVNKGPKNLETLHFVRSLNVPVVRGNHEEHVIKNWYRLKETGELSSITQKYSWIQDMTEDDVQYLQQLPYTISIPSLNAIVVHAGLYPWKPLRHQQPVDMTLIRNIIDADGPAPKASKFIDQGLPWATLWSGPEHVYFGHDARRKLQQHRFATGLDTGCLYGDRLTGCYLTGEKRFVSVKSRKVYRQPKS